MASQPSKSPVESNIKETIEAILVAFMLAFIFRAFVVEAFVIPTGSMAPTLLGAHMRFRCPDCGYHFDVNFSGNDLGGDDVEIPTSAGANRTFALFCPNCGYRIPRENLQDPVNQANNPSVRYGDRILVLKFLYLFQDPRRWDVVVFKSPYDPARYDYSQNYIKRLVGKPNETIMILDGDIYVSKKGTDPASFEVQTKPASVQDSLWRIVNDNDFQPLELDRKHLQNAAGEIVRDDPSWEQPWKQTVGEQGWDLGATIPARRQFKFSNPTGSASLFFDASANPHTFALTDWLAYDVTESQGGDADTYLRNPTSPDNNNVSDVKLEFFYQRTSGQGPLSVQLTKLDHTFVAQIGSNQATLLMDGQPVAGPKPLSFGSGPRHIEMINADYHVSLMVDGEELLATNPEQYHPDVPALLEAFRSGKKSPKPDIRITADEQVCTLDHVRLWRDIYYLNRERPGQSPMQWGTPMAFPSNLMQLGPDEFFVMGDNSFVSLDARYWNQPIKLPHEELDVKSGRVPRRFMLGKAFFVYWPAGYRPTEWAPAIVPDVGDMRFIH